FETLQIPIRRGRDLADSDLRFLGETPTPIVVNQTFAERFFGAGDPIGRTIVLEADGRGGPDRRLEIAGVARDSRTRSLDEDPHPVVYLPEAGDFLLVRVAGPASGAVRTIERALWSAEAVAWVDAQPLEAQVAFAQRPAQFGGGALAALGAIGLVMAMVGLYAMVSYGVNRRTFEIGVRLAVGAPRAAVLRMVVREGVVLVAIGCAIGLAAAQLAIRAIAPLVTLNRGRFDPVALGAVVAMMALVGAAASFAPALRASRVDPVVALRHD
ncbi:MAG TPA: FtsX-like permease family protein, partial [Vicinamibacterales bacterium]|nr:FtsX-like permease family protein [Vicinamibacterales bacterium]